MSEALPEPRVLLIRGKQTARRLVLPPFGAVKIGRAPDNDVVLYEPGVLDAHAVLHVDFGVGVEIGADATLAIANEGARQSIQGPTTVELELGTSVVLGSIELRVEEIESARQERHLLAADLAPDDIVRIRVEGAIEEAEAQEVLFSVLSDDDVAYDLSDGVYAIQQAKSSSATTELLATRFSKQGFTMRVLSGDEPAPVAKGAAPIEDASTEPFGSLRDELAALEKKRILQALEKFPNQQEAAKALDIPIRTFVNRMDALGIPRRRSKKKS
ncbi:MAG: helix-turn-helix domain-containing protein [Deltaproteobacteria bacterium]|jgi:hypothetical protein